MNEAIRTAFINAATWNGSLAEANQLLAAHPELAASTIHTAAITGNVNAVKRLLAADAANATAVAPPYGGNALVYLCLSHYLRTDKHKHADFIAAATALLDAGADANSGFEVGGPWPGFESALYGAAGVAHDGELTQLLIERGADPNDIEAVYHSPESYDNSALKALVETGKLTTKNLSIMLIRKLDIHDYDGLKYVLQHGADPNGETSNKWFSLHHSLKRTNGLPFIELLLEYGADPLLEDGGINAIVHAINEGRGDVLALFEQKGISYNLNMPQQLLAACAKGDEAAVKTIVAENPALPAQMEFTGGEYLARFSGIGNVRGVQLLLSLGIPVDAPYVSGDGYFGIPTGSLAIHVAAWRGFPEVVKVLLAAGSPVDTPDKNGHTPLMLAVAACVHSYWMQRRSPDSVQALLAAGASAQQIPLPTGYDAIDVLLGAS